MNNFFLKIKAFVVGHKVWSALIVVVIVGGGYYLIQKEKSAQTTTTYTLSTASKGTVITTIT